MTDPNPLLAGRAWFVPQPLTRWALTAACDPLIGEHDFSSFCRRPKVAAGEPEPSMVRRVLSARWSELDDPAHLRFEIRGTVAARADALGVHHVHVSLSHDAGIASAVVVLET